MPIKKKNVLAEMNDGTIKDSINDYLKLYKIIATDAELNQYVEDAFKAHRSKESSVFIYLAELPAYIFKQRQLVRKQNSKATLLLIKRQVEKERLKYEVYNRAGEFLGKFRNRKEIEVFLGCGNSAITQYLKHSHLPFNIKRV